MKLAVLKTIHGVTEWMNGSLSPLDCSYHLTPTYGYAMLYCLIVSCIFVIALHVLVPSKVRKLDRNNPKHIKWRTIASLLVCILVSISYPIFFCDLSYPDTTTTTTEPTQELPSISHIQSIRGIMLHTCILYFGSILTSLLYLHELRKKRHHEQQQKVGTTKIVVQPSYLYEVYTTFLKPSIGSMINPCTKQECWINIRNYIAAPITEELVFRRCFVPILLCTGMPNSQVALVAPIFFGVAHVHHAMSKLGTMTISRIVVVTLFQFAYTTLFGSYASYAYIRTGSIWGVITTHAYCNWMGLPDASFWNKYSPIYKYRALLVASYVLGVWSFHWFLSNSYLLPLPAILPQLVMSQE